jgi:glucokinase
METKILGVDIGATKIHLGIVQDNKVIKESKFSTHSSASKNDIVRNLIEGIEALGIQDFQGIGIGVPGLVDDKNGIVYDLLNIPSWKEVPLKMYLEDHFNIPVKVTNDANVFVLGEKIFGEGKKFRNIVGITMGSGFGTGIIANNELYSGTLSSAGEIGCIPYLDKTIEDYCSGKFFKELYNLNGAEVLARAEKGDKKALVILEEFGKHLGNAVKLIMYALSPEAIFLGGSVSKSFKYFEKSLNQSMGLFPFKRVLNKVNIQASVMENIPILGAAALILADSETFMNSVTKETL